jgi:hypothetical protein
MKDVIVITELYVGLELGKGSGKKLAYNKLKLVPDFEAAFILVGRLSKYC